jgi:NAD(P)H-flavin reductase
MNSNSAVIHQVFELSGQRAAEVHCQQPIHTEPGQYVALVSEELDSPVPFTPFITAANGHTLQVSPIPESWQPGKVIKVRGGLGRGFHLPVDSTRVALIAFDQHPNRLLYQLSVCHHAGKEIILVCDHFLALSTPPQLPLSVEVLPLANIQDAIQWAQTVDIDCQAEQLSKMEPYRDLLQGKARDSLVEVLVAAEMPCLGIAECGVCAVQTRKGYRLACKDGPVFRFESLFY